MKYVLLITVILLSGLGVFAQETTIDKAEFDKVIFGNLQALRNQSYRTIEESENQGLGGVAKTKLVTEKSGINMRSVFESDSATNYSKTETIYVNGKRFVKKLDSPWKEETLQTNYQPSDVFETLKDEKTYKFLGEQTVDNKKAKVYQSVSVRVTAKKDNSFQSERKEITTYYIDESGVIFRSESNMEAINQGKSAAESGRKDKPFKTTSKRIKTTEIDPSIKIEVPQVG